MQVCSGAGPAPALEGSICSATDRRRGRAGCPSAPPSPEEEVEEGSGTTQGGGTTRGEADFVSSSTFLTSPSRSHDDAVEEAAAAAAEEEEEEEPAFLLRVRTLILSRPRALAGTKNVGARGFKFADERLADGSIEWRGSLGSGCAQAWGRRGGGGGRLG